MNEELYSAFFSRSVKSAEGIISGSNDFVVLSLIERILSDVKDMIRYGRDKTTILSEVERLEKLSASEGDIAFELMAESYGKTNEEQYSEYVRDNKLAV